MVDKEFQEYAAACVDKGITMEQFWEYASTISNMNVEQFKTYFFESNRVSEFLGVRAYKMRATFWAELNK